MCAIPGADPVSDTNERTVTLAEMDASVGSVPDLPEDEIAARYYSDEEFWQRFGCVATTAPPTEPIGVADDGAIHGLEDDYATFTKRGERGDHDLWGQHLQNLIRSRLGDAALDLIDWEFHTEDGNQLARISIEPSGHPIQERKGDQEIFWHRTPASTVSITDPTERDKIIVRRWGPI